MHASFFMTRVSALALGCFSLAAAACSSSSTTPTGHDSGSTDTGTSHADTGTTHEDSGKPHDAGTSKDTGTSAEASAPFSACGHPGDKGNELGVGQYCTQVSDCPATAQLCSAIANADGSTRNTFFCVLTCNACSPVGYCGTGASCQCLEPGECGCAPDTCSAVFLDGGAGVCADAATDAG